ncbi:MAG: SIMPL domain-containing protein [Candidatus Pacebacteria bacterium]|nr:SIMPL domain-containing protein [Candidatus Paceibacterota bacterium]
MNFFDRPFVIPSIFLAFALLLGLGVVGWGISARGQQNTISVTGSASVSATADTATWTIDISETASTGGVAASAERVAQDASAIAKYLTNQNFSSSTIATAAVTTNTNYSSNGGPTTYNVTDSVTVSTSDVHKIDALSHDIGSLNNVVMDGAIVSPEQPQYYVSTLPDIRVSLLGAAIKDAKARATQIAQSGGSSVGPLETASSGVVQVLAPNSANVQDYGQYDTSTIQKQVTVTVRADFYVR